MDIRYSCNPQDMKRYTTDELRREFLISNLYRPGEVTAVYSHVDRMVTLGCMPVKEPVPIDQGIDVWANFGTHTFLERREIGVFNIGGAGYHCGRDPLRPGIQGLPVHHPRSKGGAVRQRRSHKAREVLHGLRPRAPQL